MNTKIVETKVTLESISKLITKSIANLATKDDLKGFATKDDLKGFATKDDLKGFATKDDLKNTEDKLNRAISNLPTRDEMNTAINTAIENNFDEMSGMVARSMDGLEQRLTKRIDGVEQGLTAKIDGLEQKVDRNHVGLSKQIEYFSQNYTKRALHEGLDLRVKRLEKVC